MARMIVGEDKGIFSKNGERRFAERRSDEDTGAWKIVDEYWSRFAYRRCEGSRRRVDSSAGHWYDIGSSPSDSSPSFVK